MKSLTKLFLVTTLGLFINFNASAIDIDDAFNKLNSIQLDNVKNATTEDIGNKLGDQLKAKANEGIKDLKIEIQAKIDEAVQKVEEKQGMIDSVINDIKSNIDKVTSLSSKIEGYIALAKYSIIFALIAILLMTLFIWRMWKNVTNIKKVVGALMGYKKLQEEMDQLHQEVDAIKAALGHKSDGTPQ
jgi:peptidoglycan hydrolase CwlO-like protein